MKDLTKELTVFVISSGENPNYTGCLEALKKQTCRFTLNIIREYSPLSRAFQEMINRAQTPYYIECDEDMILNANAAEKMYNDIAGEMYDAKAAMRAYMLQDPHLGMPIYGIKIYKTEILKKYPYNLNHPSCEVEQLKRMEQDGFIYQLVEQTVGEHSPLWTTSLIFERYYNLMEKFKIFRYVWMEQLPRKLFNKALLQPNQLNLAAYSGVLASIFSENTMEEEKDIRKINRNYGRLAGYLERPHQCTLYISSNCNFKCDFCYRQHHEVEQAPDMPSDMVDLVMGKFPEVNGFCICGFCEPLLSPSLIPILKKLKAANKVVGLITNGSLLTKRLPELCGWYKPDYISVSLNAYTEAAHEAITRTKEWEHVIAGIKALVASPIKAVVSSVVTSKNFYDLPDLIQFVRGLGVKTLHLHNLLPHCDITNNKDFWDLALTAEHEAELWAMKCHPDFSIVKKWPTAINPGQSRGACKFPFYSFAVNGAGSLSYCNSVLPCDRRFGNIKDFVVWNSPQAQQFREDFCKGDLPHCNMCFRNWEWDGRKE